MIINNILLIVVVVRNAVIQGHRYLLVSGQAVDRSWISGHNQEANGSGYDSNQTRSKLVRFKRKIHGGYQSGIFFLKFECGLRKIFTAFLWFR